MRTKKTTKRNGQFKRTDEVPCKEHGCQWIKMESLSFFLFNLYLP